jgi:integrase
MSTLRQALADYLALRRALGYKLLNEEQLLCQFLTYLEARAQKRITVEHALAWAVLPGGKESWHYCRLQAVRGFARHLHAIDPDCEVPPADLLRRGARGVTPYLYSDQDIAALMAAAAMLGSSHRRATFRTLIGLLAATGMRVGEAIRLDRGDLDFTGELLLVREGKFGKSRELPLHESTLQALRSYLRRADRPRVAPGTDALLLAKTGRALIYQNVSQAFVGLVRRAGLSSRGASRPRMHDLRHTFAVRTLLDAYRTGEDVQAQVPLLSTYMGHVNPANTYWYLQAAPELLALAGERLERHLQGGTQ